MDLDGDLIMPSTKVCNLGVLVDSTFSFNDHIGKVVKTAFFHLCNISRIRSSLSQQDVETVIHAFVTSQLDYCNSLLYGLSTNNIKRLQYVQNSAARLITHTRKNDHITPIVYHLHWLPVSLHINYKIQIFTYIPLHNLGPTYLSELLLPYVSARSLRSSSEGLLVTTNGAFSLHGMVQYGSLLGGFPLGTVPGTFLVPPQPGFQAIRTVTKT